jgi:hypothetical protein
MCSCKVFDLMDKDKGGTLTAEEVRWCAGDSNDVSQTHAIDSSRRVIAAGISKQAPWSHANTSTIEQ